MIPERILHIHGGIAEAAFPDGATLACEKCRREEQATREQCAEYLRSGWPRCCGETMTLSKPQTPRAAGRGA